MNEFKEVLDIIISWPTVAIICLFILRKPIGLLFNRFINSNSGKAKIGPIEIELGELAKEGRIAVKKLNDINLILAESRLLELEITMNSFGAAFSENQKIKMIEQIKELKKLLK